MRKVILFLAANPRDTDPLRLDEEIREIEEGLKRAKQRDQFELRQRWAVRAVDLRRAMLDHDPQIVHFAGHGHGSNGIVLEDELGYTQAVNSEALTGLFSLFPEVECVLLNACYTDTQAEAIASTVTHVVGMTQGIGDRAAVQFAASFYDAIGAGKPIGFAFKFACNALQLAGIPEHLTPRLKTNDSKERLAKRKTKHPLYDR